MMRPGPKLSADVDERIADLHAQRFGRRRIAKLLGIGEMTVRRHLKEMGIRSHAAGNPPGPKHPAWRGGSWIGADGYRYIWAGTHPFPRRSSRIAEHVAVMERHLGRRLRRGEVVHHIDGDKLNNDLSNLRLMTISAHVTLHHALRRQEEATC